MGLGPPALIRPSNAPGSAPSAPSPAYSPALAPMPWASSSTKPSAIQRPWSRPPMPSTASPLSTGAASSGAMPASEPAPRAALSSSRRLAPGARTVIRAALFLAAFLVTAWPHETRAQDAIAIRSVNALNDMARAQRSQAESLRRLESLERNRTRAADTARHTAERDARSLRRFDR